MKATMSRDGLKRIELHTVHRLTGRDVATLVLVYRATGYTDAPAIGQPWSRGDLARFLRRVLAACGDNAYTWPPEDWHVYYELDGNLAEALQWAASLVAEHLPELHDKDLVAWLDEELREVS